MRREPLLSDREMLIALTALAATRHEKNEHIIVEDWPKLSEMDQNVLLGSFSWLGTASHTRWIKAKNMVLVGGYASTPGDICRDYLSLKFRNRKRITAEQKASIMVRRSHPLYAQPMRLIDGSYIDIKSAFWSILCIVGWDCDYFPNRWLTPGESLADFPFSGHKMTRNCLVTMGRLGKSKMWLHNRKTIVSKSLGNRFVNYQLWSAVMDILNGVASDVLPLVQYIHTDGYICDTEDAEEVQNRILSWGLPSRVKQRGLCNIHGPGQYGFNSQAYKRFPNPETGLVGVYQSNRRATLHSWTAKLAKIASPPLDY